MKNNEMKLAGEIKTEPVFYKEIDGDNYYIIHLEVLRKSNVVDLLPVLVDECMLDNISIGSYLYIVGEIKTYNETIDNKRRLLLFGKTLSYKNLTEKEYKEYEECNDIEFIGFLCKEPNYRETPLKKELADLLIAVNNSETQESEYIPTIAWYKNAKLANDLEVGTKVKCRGRLQSRQYIKGEETKLTYEVSLKELSVI